MLGTARLFFEAGRQSKAAPACRPVATANSMAGSVRECEDIAADNHTAGSKMACSGWIARPVAKCVCKKAHCGLLASRPRGKQSCTIATQWCSKCDHQGVSAVMSYQSIPWRSQKTYRSWENCAAVATSVPRHTPRHTSGHGCPSAHRAWATECRLCVLLVAPYLHRRVSLLLPSPLLAARNFKLLDELDDAEKAKNDPGISLGE